MKVSDKSISAPRTAESYQGQNDSVIKKILSKETQVAPSLGKRNSQDAFTVAVGVAAVAVAVTVAPVATAAVSAGYAIWSMFRKSNESKDKLVSSSTQTVGSNTETGAIYLPVPVSVEIVQYPQLLTLFSELQPNIERAVQAGEDVPQAIVDQLAEESQKTQEIGIKIRELHSCDHETLWKYYESRDTELRRLLEETVRKSFGDQAKVLYIRIEKGCIFATIGFVIQVAQFVNSTYKDYKEGKGLVIPVINFFKSVVTGLRRIIQDLDDGLTEFFA
ncbi:MAG: hypothetical protein KME15_22190 [Drouetiella hepatica Uher 2000/2452]|jgi:hypothetical protein|uniref:Uncharacterized protein n=1 Tax=Drouetiella hepatica Uher 2000/2452 TaxID=904376 RepID=A0A951QF42_9CYAN|nr:hypothetical protein [Drouetiella hepatica Uher 2000/2452]